MYNEQYSKVFRLAHELPPARQRVQDVNASIRRQVLLYSRWQPNIALFCVPFDAARAVERALREVAQRDVYL